MIELYFNFIYMHGYAPGPQLHATINAEIKKRGMYQKKVKVEFLTFT